MRLEDDIDFTTLSWVKRELDETLNQARLALQAFVEDPSDTSQMRFCATYLHQVHGTLAMVELHGAALVVEDALLSALENGSIAGAALDVFMQEPLPPESPFWKAPNCMVSPHMSGDFAEFENVMADQFIANWHEPEAQAFVTLVIDLPNDKVYSSVLAAYGSAEEQVWLHEADLHETRGLD